MSDGRSLGASQFRCEPDPEFPGWNTWETLDSGRFNSAVIGRMLVRREDGAAVRLRMFPAHHHANLPGGLHGGVILAFADIALFATLNLVSDADAAGSATLDLHCQFIAPGHVAGEPIDAVSELLRETGRLAFLRGRIEQAGTLVASYSGTIRKAAARP